ncbi:MAG TPA: glycosyltransferase family 1 protein [Roseiarcus sp.]|nr:glycosyltransferase family 1 protein [Roseiarcus sp.]
MYDITRLVTRVFKRTPNGIDRVDCALAGHFLGGGGAHRSGLMMTALGPRVLKPVAAREAIDNIRKHWGENIEPDSDVDYQAVVAAIDGGAAAVNRISKGRKGQYADAWSWLGRHGFPWGESPRKFLAQGGVYLNISQFLLEANWYLRWIQEQHIDAVFFIHDLLPLQMPEYFVPAEYPRHARRMNILARLGRAAIVSTEVVREALLRHLATLGRADMPVLVAPLPPDPIFAAPRAGESRRIRRPYFVICGTIEPRKNHLLILHIWRDLVAELGEAAPKLILIGARGWENELIIDMLERCPALRGFVIEASGLPTPSVKRLLLESRALLMPSFAEGYGLPIVEALALGVPVIASDIPVFREIGGGRLTTIDPTDGPGWRAAIRAFMEHDSPQRAAYGARLQGYSPPDWPGFFATIESFLDDLPRLNRRAA